MHLAFHGGLCCGIKTIYGFGFVPQMSLPALSEKALDDSDVFGSTVKSNQRFFHEAAPAETCLQRLDRYIAYVKLRRPRHIIEVTLATTEPNSGGQFVWFPLLRRRGFKRVTMNKNSNSGNYVHIFHKVINP